MSELEYQLNDNLWLNISVERSLSVRWMFAQRWTITKVANKKNDEFKRQLNYHWEGMAVQPSLRESFILTQE